MCSLTRFLVISDHTSQRDLLILTVQVVCSATVSTCATPLLTSVHSAALPSHSRAARGPVASGQQVRGNSPVSSKVRKSGPACAPGSAVARTSPRRVWRSGARPGTVGRSQAGLVVSRTSHHTLNQARKMRAHQQAHNL